MQEALVGNKKRVTMSSLEIVELIEELPDVKNKTHADICKDIRRQLEAQNLAEGDFSSGYFDKNNQERKCYELDKTQATYLVSGYSFPIRKAIVDRMEELENILTEKKPQLPQTFSQALRALADAEEQKEQLLLEQKQNQPKIEFFNDVTDSTDAIDMGSVSKVLNKGIGRNNLFALLRLKKVLQRDNQPYQAYIDQGYFRVIETKFNKPNGDIGINLKTIVYQKGVAFISKIIDDYKEEKR